MPELWAGIDAGKAHQKQAPKTRQSSPTKQGCDGTCNPSAAATRSAPIRAYSPHAAKAWSATEHAPSKHPDAQCAPWAPALEVGTRTAPEDGVPVSVSAAAEFVT